MEGFVSRAVATIALPLVIVLLLAGCQLVVTWTTSEEVGHTDETTITPATATNKTTTIVVQPKTKEASNADNL